MPKESPAPGAVQIVAGAHPAPALLDGAALELVALLHRELASRRAALLVRRLEARHAWQAGRLPEPDASPDARALRESAWTVAATGPRPRPRLRLVAGPLGGELEAALAAGPDACVADLEDSLAPRWSAVCEAHERIAAALRGRAPDAPALLVRPRGLHALEPHLVAGGGPVAAALVDVALTALAAATADPATPVGLQVPKLEHPFEARWWADLCRLAEERAGLALGRLGVEVLVETLPAAVALDEIVHELSERASALVFGDRNYLAALAVTLGGRPGARLADATRLTPEDGVLAACARRIVRCARRRGLAAIGAPAAAVLDPRHPLLAARLAQEVRPSRRAQAAQGFDGTTVLDPGLVPLAREVFGDAERARPAEGAQPGPGSGTGAAEPEPADALVAVTERPLTLPTLQRHVHQGLCYLTAWMGGRARLVEGAAVADASCLEVARAQLWQWVEQRTRLTDGTVVTVPFVERLVAAERDAAWERLGPARFAAERVALAADLLAWLATAPDPEESMATVAAPHLAADAAAETKRAG